MKINAARSILMVAMGISLLSFNNCGQAKFEIVQGKNGGNNLILGFPDPGLTPLVKKPGVITVLLALGDQINKQLVINGVSSQLIAETAVRYASPVESPKVLVVKDSVTHDESVYDTAYIAEELLKRYNTSYLAAPIGGISLSQIQGYDVIWFNNPGYPMADVKTRDSLLAFKGGVILSGDDLSRGENFSLTSLTGLEYRDNGSEVTCQGKSYWHDNNTQYQFKVGLVENKIPGVPSSTLNFSYGNDIDNVRVASSNVEVIAYAVGGDPSCTEKRPVITRYERPSL